MKYDIVALYVCIDDFSKIYEEWERKKLIGTTKNRKREGKLSMSEQLLIVIVYHLEGFKNFKYYYKYAVEIKYKSLFKEVPCYDRFIQIMPKLLVPLSILLQCLFGEARGIYFLDATKISICHSRREKRNKVFGKIAEKGKTSMGWFFGFKLHMVINDVGQIIAIKITKGNVDDRTPVAELTKKLKGSVYADKGYIGSDLFKALYKRGLKLITGIRKNMKNYLINLADKKLLRKRFCIETIFGFLKNSMNLEHTRHRSPVNFLVNLIAALTAYSLTKGKPKNLTISTSLIHS